MYPAGKNEPVAPSSVEARFLGHDVTRDDDNGDVPIRVDFRDPATARTWIEDTRIKRPYRPRFFAAFCAALASRPKLRILELGSGPGHLAREILVHCDVHIYVALDFSPAMHEIAAEHLGELVSPTGCAPAHVGATRPHGMWSGAGSCTRDTAMSFSRSTRGSITRSAIARRWGRGTPPRADAVLWLARSVAR